MPATTKCERQRLQPGAVADARATCKHVNRGTPLQPMKTTARATHPLPDVDANEAARALATGTARPQVARHEIESYLQTT